MKACADSGVVGCEMKLGRRGKRWRIDSVYEEEVEIHDPQTQTMRCMVIRAVSFYNRRIIDFVFPFEFIEDMVREKNKIVHFFKKAKGRFRTLTIFIGKDFLSSSEEFAFAE